MTYLYMYALTCNNSYIIKYINCPIISYNLYKDDFPALTGRSPRPQVCPGSVSI